MRKLSPGQSLEKPLFRFTIEQPSRVSFRGPALLLQTVRANYTSFTSGPLVGPNGILILALEPFGLLGAPQLRIKPLISCSAQAIALSIGSCCCVQCATSFVIVA
jgi:hypothetical protein